MHEEDEATEVKTVNLSDTQPPLPAHLMARVESGLLLMQQTMHDLDACREELRQARLEISTLKVELHSTQLMRDAANDRASEVMVERDAAVRAAQAERDEAVQNLSYLESICGHLKRYLDEYVGLPEPVLRKRLERRPRTRNGDNGNGNGGEPDVKRAEDVS